jgi:hypothetical protein
LAARDVQKNAPEDDEETAPEDAEEPHWVYTEVSDPEADSVLVIVLNIPGLPDAVEHSFPLKRHLDATGSDMTDVNTHWAADGVSEDGHGIGCVGSISLHGGNATHFTVRVSVVGKGKDLKRIAVEEEIQVPWLGQIEKALAQGGTIAARFESPETKR